MPNGNGNGNGRKKKRGRRRLIFGGLAIAIVVAFGSMAMGNGTAIVGSGVNMGDNYCAGTGVTSSTCP